MLFVASFIAYIISSIRISFCVFLIVVTTFVVMLPFDIKPLQIINNYDIFLYGILFFGTFLPFAYGILDLMYSLTVKSAGKEEISFDIHKLPQMMWVSEIMWEVSDIFDTDISLYLEKSSKLRIYSMGSIKTKRVFISLGLITYLSSKAHDDKERNRIIGALIAGEISHLLNYDYLPMMILKGSNKIAKFLCTLATIPIRILFIPMFLTPIIKYGMIYVMNFFTTIINSIDKILYKSMLSVYNSIRYQIFEKNVEYRSDYQIAQIANKEVLIMVLAILKKLTYNDDYYCHTMAIERIKKIEQIQIKPDIQHEDRLIGAVLLCCFIFILSSILGISAEIWLLPMCIMENLIIIHNGLVIIFNKLSFVKDIIGDAYHLISIS
jgi:hypothetical protein